MINSKKVTANSKILFVNDGSKDTTWSVISKYSADNELVTGLKFSRNYGHQNALLAGMLVVVKYFDMMITIDADLQDDVNAIPKMVEKYHEGYDVVYGVRNSLKCLERDIIISLHLL